MNPFRSPKTADGLEHDDAEPPTGRDLVTVHTSGPPSVFDAAAGDLNDRLASLIRAGGVVSLVFFGVFGGWAAVAPLSSAAIAPGTVSPEGSRRIVQHLEGGIIADLTAKDGDRVKAGDPLLRLEETLSRSAHRVLLTERASLAALAARLEAEREDRTRVVFPEWLTRQASAEESIRAIITNQENLFSTRRLTHHKQMSILRLQADQLREEVSGLEAQIASQETQRALVEEEVADVATLLKEGLARRPRLLELQRQRAEVEERLAAHRAQLARTRTQVGEADLQVAAAEATRRDEVSEALVRATSELAGLADKLDASGDVLRRTTVVAPSSGVVVASRFKSAGGVVAPGAPIMEIVPDEEELIIEARVSPMDIDVVREGLKAQVRFPALSQRGLPSLEGEVIAVSADALTPAGEGAPYYTATIRVTDETRRKLGERTLTPGMNAEVQIVTGARTPLQYFFEPVTAAFGRAFKES